MPADRPHASKALGLVGRRAGPALKKYALALAGNSMLMGSAMAQTVDDRSLPGIPLTFGLQVGTLEVVQLAVFAGAVIAAVFSAGWLIYERGRIAGQNAALRGKLSATSARLAQLEALATIEGQKAIIWSSLGQSASRCSAARWS